MKKISKRIFAAAAFLAFATNAIAGSGYDGSWNLVFLTQRGAMIAEHPSTFFRVPALVTVTFQKLRTMVAFSMRWGMAQKN